MICAPSSAFRLHVVLLFVVVAAACDIFTSRVPCARDDECGVDERCADDGFCADADDVFGGEGEGEDGGEGEGEGEGVSHPLRGTSCPTIGARSPADSALRCSIFGVFEQLCDVDADCDDPAAARCVDPGPGPRLCAAGPLSRSVCPDAPGDPDEIVDGNVVVPACVDGSLTFAPNLACGAGAIANARPAILGGDLFVRLNQRAEETACTTLQIVRFGPVAVGGDVRTGVDAGTTALAGAVLTSVPLDEATTIFGSYVIEHTTSIALPAANKLERVFGDLVIVDNDSVETINLFALIEIGGDVVIEDNPLLDTLINTEPTQIGGDLIVRNNPLLPRCRLQPLIDVVDGTVTIEGVDDDASCP